MSINPPPREIQILLVENDHDSADTRKENIELFGNEGNASYEYHVTIAETEAKAIDLIEHQRFDFLLVDFLLTGNQPGSDVITESDVDDPANGSKVARRLLDYHRRTWQERPDDVQQLRPIVFSAILGEGEEAERVRVKILCDGAYDFISRDPEDINTLLRSLGEMCELQEEAYRIADGKSWLGQVLQNLGCGINIIGRNWKIWYSSPRNLEYSGTRRDKFHDLSSTSAESTGLSDAGLTVHQHGREPRRES